MDRITSKQAMLGISLISMATLMLELLVNKALTFSTWGSLGYMIIGSAIFGFSISGVVLAIWQPYKKYPLNRLVAYASLIFSVSVVLCYGVMNIVPFNFEDIPLKPLAQLLYFTIWYLFLLIPFSMTGFIIALLLYSFRERGNRLYAADLVGAGLGCMLVVPLFPLVGAAGQYFICAALGAVCAVIFSYKKLYPLMSASVVMVCLFMVFSLFAQNLYPVKTHQKKRKRYEHYKAGYIQHSMWSFLSKIEVAVIPGTDQGMIWFDGGMMESAIDRFDGDYAKEKNSPSVRGAYSIPYRIKPRKNALIIAPAGGREVRTALAWDTERITGVELDYSVVKLVANELDPYLGGIFNHPRVRNVNDEGRSFVRRSREKYDVIQFISAYSVTAIQSGAIDLASSYLVTKEAFEDYLDHLSNDGVLAIARDLNLRLFFTGWEVLEERGLSPNERMVLLAGKSLGRNTLLMKLTPFTRSELKQIADICADSGIYVNYAPASLIKTMHRKNRSLSSEPKTFNIIQCFINTPKKWRDSYYARFPFKVAPVTDDKPFFNNIRYLFRSLDEVPAFLTEELKEYTEKTWYLPHVPIGYIGRLVVLGEAAVFALLFLLFPLWKAKQPGIERGWQRISMIYFLCLGIGFIWIEVALLKIFILFVGTPVYSIAVVLFSMLIFAGIGSFFSEKLKGNLTKNFQIIGGLLFLLTLLVTFIYPDIFRLSLGLPFAVRIGIAVALIAPIGFILGMPFPIGLGFLAETSADSIPWAWAMNGYATVVGTSLAAFVAMKTGFSILIWISLLIYGTGFIALVISETAYHGKERVRTDHWVPISERS